MDRAEKVLVWIKNNPVLVFVYIGALLNLAVQLGFLDANASEAILATAESILLVGGGYYVKTKVTPTRKLRKNRH